jgi:hypothetical protein
VVEVVLFTSLFTAAAIITLFQMRRVWRLDADELAQMRFGRLSMLRGPFAALPALLAGCCLFAIGGVVVILGEKGVRPPFGVRIGFGLLWLAVMLVAIGAAYYGRPRWALLPALRSPAGYAKFMQATD